MKFVWAGNREEQYSKRIFKLSLEEACQKLVICAVDFYRVYLDGEFNCFGPERTGEGFSRKREINLKGKREIEIEVAGYNHLCYACDKQPPFFAAEVYSDKGVVYDTFSFTCYQRTDRYTDVPRFSGQRTGLEYIDLTCVKEIPLEVYSVEAPTILDGVGDTARYEKVEFSLVSQGEFKGFDDVSDAFCELNPLNLASKDGFFVKKDFLDKTEKGYSEINFSLENERTGFIKFNIKAEEQVEFFAVMEEYLIDGKWHFRRSGCNELVVIKVPKGEWEVQTFEPYAFKHLKIIYNGKVEITPSLITYENDLANFITLEGDNDIARVYFAAQNTFKQNAVDLFTDCPGRERAGWLCDSYFTAKAEQVLMGSNLIERAFLENIILSKTPEIDSRMLPKSFPSENRENQYIPNWALWFIMELKDYYDRTGDRSLVDLAKDRVYGLLDFFLEYENEFNLLEDLQGWVFVEWSVCNNPEYTKGVNYPSNMLYYACLSAVASLYDDKELDNKARIIKENIIKQSFNGEFFIENAVREDGKLKPIKDHLSETCQYYALFFNIRPSAEFEEKMITKFGPKRKDGVYLEVAKSNIFIGNYLRFFYLLEKNETERVLEEMTSYFREMVDKTGTLWEHDSPKASCNHGFASVACPIILRCVAGFNGIKNGKPIFLDIEKAKTYGLKIKVKE